MKGRETDNQAEHLELQIYPLFLSEDYSPELTAVHLQTAVQSHSEQAFFLQQSEFSAGLFSKYHLYLFPHQKNYLLSAVEFQPIFREHLLSVLQQLFPEHLLSVFQQLFREHPLLHSAALNLPFRFQRNNPLLHEM